MEEFKEEMMKILHRLRDKLQSLPEANYLELAGFYIFVVFVATVFLMIVLSCSHCWCVKTKYHATKVMPLKPI